MELKDFVSNALCDIIDGIKNAQEKTVGSGAVINPFPATPLGGRAPNYVSYAKYQPINFDLAVTINNKSGGGVGIDVFGASIGGKLNNEESTISRISFSIDVQFPAHKSGTQKT